VGEELGFAGVVLIIGLFAAFGYFGYRVALRTSDRFRSLLAFGLTTSVLYQAILNMAVVSGLVPATGIPLPFFSSGGSSAVVTLIMCGLLVNISRYADSAENESEEPIYG
jgi:cell division protein FtsW